MSSLSVRVLPMDRSWVIRWSMTNLCSLEAYRSSFDVSMRMMTETTLTWDSRTGWSSTTSTFLRAVHAPSHTLSRISSRSSRNLMALMRAIAATFAAFGLPDEHISTIRSIASSSSIMDFSLANMYLPALASTSAASVASSVSSL